MHDSSTVAPIPMVYQQLEQIQQRLEHVAVLREPQVHALIQQQINAGGKMLRSGLMLMLARLGNPDNDDLITAGAAIEALHLATWFTMMYLTTPTCAAVPIPSQPNQAIVRQSMLAISSLPSIFNY
jgi:hypothetical protein